MPGWLQRLRERWRLAQELREARQKLEQEQARNDDLVRKIQEIERIRDEAVMRRAKYQVAMRRMKDLDAELAAAIAAEDRERALELMPKASEAQVEVDRLNLEEVAYTARLAKLLAEIKEEK